jgi:hypothetical protein
VLYVLKGQKISFIKLDLLWSVPAHYLDQQANIERLPDE